MNSMRCVRHLFLTLLILAVSGCSSASAGKDSPPPPPRPFDEEISFIEDLRGVRFIEEVAHTEIRRADLRDFLRDTFARDLSISTDDYFDVLTALHLIEDEPQDPLETLLDLYMSQVLAFYDPIEDMMYSIDEAPETGGVMMTAAFERAVTIHELVHALQDQSFGAGERLSSRSDDWDRSLAYHALIEGEATLVMLAALVADLGGSLDQALEDDQIVTALGEAAAANLAQDAAPAYFIESLKFPYVEGLAYAIELYREGGWEALERAHASPPGSTEEIYDGEPPAGVEPLGVSDALFETTLGEFHWRYLLGESAADAWEADRVAFVRGASGVNVIAVTRWSSAGAAATFADLYERFLKSEGRAPVIRVEEESVLVVYGPDRDVLERLLEHRLNQEVSGMKGSNGDD